MTIAKNYLLTARFGCSADQLVEAVKGLARKYRDHPDFEGAVILQDVDEPRNVMFNHRWSSVEAFVREAEASDREMLLPLVEGEMTGHFMQYVPTD